MKMWFIPVATRKRANNSIVTFTWINRSFRSRCSGVNHCSFILNADCPISKFWGSGEVYIKFACMSGMIFSRFTPVSPRLTAIRDGRDKFSWRLMLACVGYGQMCVTMPHVGRRWSRREAESSAHLSGDQVVNYWHPHCIVYWGYNNIILSKGSRIYLRVVMVIKARGSCQNSEDYVCKSIGSIMC